MRRLPALAAAAVVLTLGGVSARAGGLIWNVPAVGTEVRHEGSLTQVLTDDTGQQVTTERRREIFVRALEEVEAEYDGSRVPAVWVEIVTVTGVRTERGIDPGPAGRVLYKFLTPRAAVAADFKDRDGIPRAFLPVLRGWRQAGDGEPTELGPAFRAYPAACLLTEFEPDEIIKVGEEDVTVPAGTYPGTLYRGKQVNESPRVRTTNDTDVIVSPDMPFGPAKWTVTLVRERKDANQPRDTFREVARTTVSMEAQEIRNDARGELPLP